MTEITSVAGESDATIKTAEAYLADLLRIPFCSLCCEMAVKSRIPLCTYVLSAIHCCPSHDWINGDVLK